MSTFRAFAFKPSLLVTGHLSIQYTVYWDASSLRLLNTSKMSVMDSIDHATTRDQQNEEKELTDNDEES